MLVSPYPHASRGSYWPSRETVLMQGTDQVSKAHGCWACNTYGRNSASGNPAMIKVAPPPPPQHRSQALGHTRPSGTHLPKPALNKGREGHKILIHQVLEAGNSSIPGVYHTSVQCTPLSSEIPHTELSDFYSISTTQKSLVTNSCDATQKIKGNPSQPKKLFWCNEQPLYLIFQKRDSALTSPSLRSAKSRRRWLSARLVGLLFIQLAASLHTCRCGCTWIHAHTYIYIFLWNGILPLRQQSAYQWAWASGCTYLGNINSSSLFLFCYYNNFADNFAYWTCSMVGVTASNSSPATGSRVTCCDCSYAGQIL